MRVHLSWIGAAALAAATLNVSQAGAQYAPYRPQQQPMPQANVYPTTYPGAMPQAAPAMSRYQAPAAQVAPATAPVATYPQYAQTATPSATQIPAYSYPQTTYPQAAQAPTYPQAAQAPSYPQTAQAPSYPSYGYPAYPRVAQQPIPPAPTEGEALPAPVPAPGEKSMATPMVDSANGAANGMAHPNGGMNGYSSTGYQTANGYSGYGQASCGYTDYGINGCCEQDCGNGHIWFGGVYWLFMERDNPNTRKLTVRVDHNVAPDPYYPQANVTVLDTDRTDFDFRSGAEVRFGCTFGIGDGCDDNCGYGYGNGCGCDSCNSCASCPSDNFAWEVAWWGLDEDNQESTYYDRDWLNNVRLYGMVNFAGIEYYDGATWRPVNEYYGYGLPIDAPDPPVAGDIIVTAQRTRSYFSCQNLELNIIRFPVCESGCGGGSCSTCGPNCAGYGTDCGYGACGCEQDCCPIAFSMCGMCGVRYFRADDDFYYGSQFAQWGGGAYGDTSWINYDINVDNNLLGPQVGWNMNYCVGCKWNFFCNSTFGIFNNHIETHQRVWGETGQTRYIQTGQNNNINATKDDISFLGELRLGGSYDLSCNWRAVLAYRALAVTGYANSVDQIPTDFTNRYYPAIIDSDSSIIVHGVQAGVECRY